ncbi:MAG TPA: glycosyltransferase family 4 protein [Phycisphaerae bacterium]|nr:glycosyltransferase family 4 protein [Phycisphaerae bacterium]
MRIVHVITRLIIGGAQENTVLSCEGLAARGHEVCLLTGPTVGPEGSLVERARRGAYAYEELPDLVRRISPLRDGRAALAMKRFFETIRPEVVHTHSSKAGVLGRLAAHWAGVPIIVHTIHGMSFNRTQPPWVQAAYRWAERLCAEMSHAIVGVADAMTEQALAAGIGRADQYVTIRSGMETEQFDPDLYDAQAMRASWGVGPEEIVVGTVARLFENKGYEAMIEVIDLAARRDGRLRFVWVGDGAHRPRYEAELSRRGLRDRVVMTGLLPPAEMPRVMAGFDILAHASRWEGLPRAVVQALIMGRPAVSFAIDGAPEVVIPGETGELVGLGDVSGFAESIVALAGSSARRAAYGRNGRRLWLRAFSAEKMVDELDVLYARLAAARRERV